jgi:type IV pilus assembly protein PilV
MNPCFRRHLGSILIEVLIALIVFSIGLLGMAGLLGAAQRSEMESYQRSYGLMLLDDMASRIRSNVTANRGTRVCYDLGSGSLGSGTTFTATGCDAIADADLTAWDAQLKGSSELENDVAAGAMLGARGCIRQDAADARIVHVSVAWQGLSETAEPSASDCGSGLYGNEARRRVVTRALRFANAID